MQPLLVALPLLAAPSAAHPQDFSPAPELEQFHGLIGTFEGGGQVRMAPGAEPASWSAVSTGKLILGDHFVQLDETIKTPMGPLEFRTLYGWDRERSRPLVYTVGSMGMSPPTMTATWVDGALVLVHGTVEMGEPYADRATTVIADDGYAFVMRRMAAGGETFDMVSGKMTRVAKDSVIAAALTAPEPGEEMARLEPMLGDWEMTGAINMMGMEMDITATEKIEWSYGASAITGKIHGEPGGYESDWYVAYDPEAGCYRHLYASNMGEMGMSEGRFVDGKLVFTEHRVQMGSPVVSRTVIELGDGGISSARQHTLAGTEDPVLSFSADYSRAGGAKLVSRFTPGSCCAKAEAAGGACKHPCCVAAAKDGGVCKTCNK